MGLTLSHLHFAGRCHGFELIFAVQTVDPCYDWAPRWASGPRAIIYDLLDDRYLKFQADVFCMLTIYAFRLLILLYHHTICFRRTTNVRAPHLLAYVYAPLMYILYFVS